MCNYRSSHATTKSQRGNTAAFRPTTSKWHRGKWSANKRYAARAKSDLSSASCSLQGFSKRRNPLTCRRWCYTCSETGGSAVVNSPSPCLIWIHVSQFFSRWDYFDFPDLPTSGVCPSRTVDHHCGTNSFQSHRVHLEFKWD